MPRSPKLSFAATSPADWQHPFDVAVVMPTVLRPSATAAIRSVLAQRDIGRLQLLIGIDAPLGEMRVIEDAVRDAPPHIAVQVFDPGYSTSVRHGGLHPARDGGALRTILSYLANSRYVAYLDDDNWWHEDHLASLLAAVQGHDWAWAARHFVHPRTRAVVCEDTWESIGPGAGCFAMQGGWVDPNGLLIDKLVCEPVLRWWSIPIPTDPKAMSADRHVFDALQKHFRGRGTGRATVFYQLDPEDSMHPIRRQWMGEAWVRAGGD
jgi:hypothetical protein